MYSLKKDKRIQKITLKDEHIAEKYKILKKTFFKSVNLRDIIYSRIRYQARRNEKILGVGLGVY